MSQEATPIEVAQPTNPAMANQDTSPVNEEEMDATGEQDAQSTDVE